MTNTIKQFGYKVLAMKLGDLPIGPIVILNLNHWTCESDSIPQISAHLMCDGEIDEHIKALKTDLDAVGRKAKKALKNAQVKTAKIIAG